MINVCLIGHLGGREKFREGQTVKTQHLVDAIQSDENIRLRCADTYYCRKNILKFAMQLLGGLAASDRVVLCVSKGGRRIFYPMLYWCTRIFGKKVYHCTIGGRVAEEIQEHPEWKKYVQSFQVNWVESHLIVDHFEQLGVTNAVYLPNFKKLPVVSSEELRTSLSTPARFCIFSRITEEKGVTDAIHAIAEVNRRYGDTRAVLDLYGPVAPEYESALAALLAEHSGYVKYCGTAAPESSVEILKEYDFLLFPTRRFSREGIPGTVIDALCAGVPVISRQWKYGHEMLTHGYNGFCYDFEAPEMLPHWIEYAISHPEMLPQMKKNCLASAEEYRMEHVAPEICHKLAL